MWRGLLLAGLAYFGIAVFIQSNRGAMESAFGDYPDEPAHYVTGKGPAVNAILQQLFHRDVAHDCSSSRKCGASSGV